MTDRQPPADQPREKVLHEWADTDMTLRLLDDPLRVEGIDAEDPADEWTADATLLRFYGLRELARLAAIVKTAPRYTNAQVQELVEERDRLRSALIEHGEHRAHCHAMFLADGGTITIEEESQCDCGLRAALSAMGGRQ